MHFCGQANRICCTKPTAVLPFDAILSDKGKVMYRLLPFSGHGAWACQPQLTGCSETFWNQRHPLTRSIEASTDHKAPQHLAMAMFMQIARPSLLGTHSCLQSGAGLCIALRVPLLRLLERCLQWMWCYPKKNLWEHWHFLPVQIRIFPSQCQRHNFVSRTDVCFIHLKSLRLFSQGSISTTGALLSVPLRSPPSISPVAFPSSFFSTPLLSLSVLPSLPLVLPTTFSFFAQSLCIQAHFLLTPLCLFLCFPVSYASSIPFSFPPLPFPELE